MLFPARWISVNGGNWRGGISYRLLLYIEKWDDSYVYTTIRQQCWTKALARRRLGRNKEKQKKIFEGMYSVIVSFWWNKGPARTKLTKLFSSLIFMRANEEIKFFWFRFFFKRTKSYLHYINLNLSFSFCHLSSVRTYEHEQVTSMITLWSISYS